MKIINIFKINKKLISNIKCYKYEKFFIKPKLIHNTYNVKFEINKDLINDYNLLKLICENKLLESNRKNIENYIIDNKLIYNNTNKNLVFKLINFILLSDNGKQIIKNDIYNIFKDINNLSIMDSLETIKLIKLIEYQIVNLHLYNILIELCNIIKFKIKNRLKLKINITILELTKILDCCVLLGNQIFDIKFYEVLYDILNNEIKLNKFDFIKIQENIIGITILFLEEEMTKNNSNTMEFLLIFINNNKELFEKNNINNIIQILNINIKNIINTSFKLYLIEKIGFLLFIDNNKILENISFYSILSDIKYNHENILNIIDKLLTTNYIFRILINTFIEDFFNFLIKYFENNFKLIYEDYFIRILLYIFYNHYFVSKIISKIKKFLNLITSNSIHIPISIIISLSKFAIIPEDIEFIKLYLDILPDENFIIYYIILKEKLLNISYIKKFKNIIYNSNKNNNKFIKFISKNKITINELYFSLSSEYNNIQIIIYSIIIDMYNKSKLLSEDNILNVINFRKSEIIFIENLFKNYSVFLYLSSNFIKFLQIFIYKIDISNLKICDIQILYRYFLISINISNLLNRDYNELTTNFNWLLNIIIRCDYKNTISIKILNKIIQLNNYKRNNDYDILIFNPWIKLNEEIKEFEINNINQLIVIIWIKSFKKDNKFPIKINKLLLEKIENWYVLKDILKIYPKAKLVKIFNYPLKAIFINENNKDVILISELNKNIIDFRTKRILEIIKIFYPESNLYIIGNAEIISKTKIQRNLMFLNFKNFNNISI